MQKIMMGTSATHKLGDISRKSPQPCIITEEDSEYFIGEWAFHISYAFVSVKFPKSTTRPLTDDEKQMHGDLQPRGYLYTLRGNGCQWVVMVVHKTRNIGSGLFFLLALNILNDEKMIKYEYE